MNKDAHDPYDYFQSREMTTLFVNRLRTGLLDF